MAVAPQPRSVPAAGVLYFDPNPTTARLATAGLQLAGYRVHHAPTQDQAVELARKHGPGGDKSIVALLLDTATSPAVSGSVLRALVVVPGAADLPGILLVSRANPTPIPGAEELPSLKRPFTIPALLKVLRETIESAPPPGTFEQDKISDALRMRVAMLFEEFFPNLPASEDDIDQFAEALVQEGDVPTPAAGISVLADLATTRLESLLDMLSRDGVRGVLAVEADEAYGRLHLDHGCIRMAEVSGASEDLRVGRFIVEAGFMSSEQIESIASTTDPKGRVLGQRLVDDGHLRRGELTQVLLNQAREVTCHIMKWKDGMVTLAPTGELHPLAAQTAKSRAELRISDALLDGLRRQADEAEMGPHMPGAEDVYVRIDTEVAKLGRHAFSREELSTLELLNGRNAIKDIARKTRTGTFAVSKVVYRLTRAHLSRRRMVPVRA
ncbi:MAG: DUF4388 domain-containing protein [Myxococcota bacterium]